jgi:hypothetical protein
MNCKTCLMKLFQKEYQIELLTLDNTSFDRVSNNWNNFHNCRDLLAVLWSIRLLEGNRFICAWSSNGGPWRLLYDAYREFLSSNDKRAEIINFKWVPSWLNLNIMFEAIISFLCSLVILFFLHSYYISTVI